MDYDDLKIIVSSVPGLWQSRGKPGGQAEKNSIVTKFSSFNLKIKNAQESQSILQLKSKYCDHYKCLSCAVGNYVMGR